MMDKAILTCALTGVLTNPKQHPVPVTPAQMAAEARDAFNAGRASCMCTCACRRKAWATCPSWDPDVAEAVVNAIREACPGVIINLTTGVVGKDISGPLACIRRVQARDRRLQRRQPELPEDQGRRQLGLAAHGVRQPGGPRSSSSWT
jgi:3-keto-5-aminohexanoate cleavage enzyme